MIHFPRWKIILILAVLVAGLIYAAPNLISREAAERLPSWIPHQQINLGLDLQGGSHLLFSVDLDSVIRDQLQSMVDAVRTELRGADIGYTDLGVDGHAVTATLRDPATVDQARDLLRDIVGDMTLSIDDGGRIRITLGEQAITDRARHAVQQSIEIIRRRIDETGVREPTIQQQGKDRILVQLPGIRDPERVKALIGKTAKMTFRFVDSDISPQAAQSGRLPPTVELLPAADSGPGEPRQYVVEKRVMVSGENLVDAQPTFQNGQPVVSFRFDSVGAKRFAAATRDNVGRLFAIVLDNEVISAPVIREPILGGSGVISGNFTVQSAQDLAVLLRAGALPAPLKVLEERSVGPNLGADSIRVGIYACIIGFVLVTTYMVAAYGFFGLIADVALIFNLILTLAALSVLQATLTLPGIAGLLLTLGMSVDANVLINERIREETLLGRSPISALDAGYKRAFNTILDSNLTTLIKMMLLYSFGTGAVKGFAVTISLGIITSMFTAIVLARLLMVTWLRHRRPVRLPV